jgi:preprotein translocase subunit SecB
MKNAPLSVDFSYPTLVHLISDPQGASEVKYDVTCEIEVWRGESNPRKWRVQLRVEFKPKAGTNAAHRGEITYVGIFTVADDCPEEKMYRLIGVDAPSILYSSIRELVALLTGRGPTKTVLLPTVSFIENVVVPAPETPSEARSASSPSAQSKPRATTRRRHHRPSVHQ